MSSSQADAKKQNTELQQNLEIFQQIPLFEGLPASVLKLLAYLGVRGDYQKGDLIMEKGEDLSMAFYILSGKLTLYNKKKINGIQPLREYSEGQFLGGLSLLGELPSLFTLKADTSCKLLLLHRKVFGKVVEEHPELREKLLQAMLEQLHRWEKYNLKDLENCSLQSIGVTLL